MAKSDFELTNALRKARGLPPIAGVVFEDGSTLRIGIDLVDLVPENQLRGVTVGPGLMPVSGGGGHSYGLGPEPLPFEGALRVDPGGSLISAYQGGSWVVIGSVDKLTGP